MDRCPPEIHHRIFQFACTDSGYTGRALALTSQYIHSTSLDFKFQSIELTGASQVRAFAAFLEKSLPKRNRVLRLIVANDAVTAPIDSDDEGPSSSIIKRIIPKATGLIPGVKRHRLLKKLRERGGRATQCIEANRSRDEAIFGAFLRILQLVAGTLQSLTIDFESRWRIIPPGLSFSPSSLPYLGCLTSLTINYYALYHAELDDALIQNLMMAREGGMLPRLRYLDLAGLRIRSHPFDLYGFIGKVAPGLTHLRLPVRMTGGLAKALGVGRRGRVEPEDWSGTSSDTSINSVHTTSTPPTKLEARLPSSLERIYVQLSPPMEYSCCGGGSWEQGAKRRLEALALKDERIVVLNADEEDNVDLSGDEFGWDMDVDVPFFGRESSSASGSRLRRRTNSNAFPTPSPPSIVRPEPKVYLARSM